MTAIALAASLAGAATPPKPGVAADLAFETSQFLLSTAYRSPDRVALDISDSGACTPVNRQWDKTHEGPWYIEQQRYAFDAVAVGLALDRQDLVARGEKILDWGFAQENPDGSFDCPDRFHSASFFIEAAAHSALLLQASKMRQANQAWIDKIKPPLRLAARWMLDAKNEKPGRAHDRPYTHRYYLDAAALGETGVLTGDEELIERSKDYIREGLTRQDPSGFNPEKGGFDTSYHAAGLFFALNYYELVADAAARRSLAPMLDKGVAWLRSRLRPDGTVEQAGNTRTGAGQERGRNGTLKTMSYGSAYRAFYHWGMLKGDAALQSDALRLYQGDQIERKRSATK
jgi:hypothetical protein